VYTALPMLIAEEFGVEPGAMQIEFAPPGAEFVNGLLGTQAAGASTSIRDAWENFGWPAPKRASVFSRQARTRLHGQRGLCRIVNKGVAFGDKVIGFGEIAAAAAALPETAKYQTETAGLHDHRQDPAPLGHACQSRRFRAIRHRRPLARHVVRGACAQSPVLGGTVKSFNADKAKAMPGVKQVLQTSSGVVVVADTWWQARQARNALDIQWDTSAGAKLSNAAIVSGLAGATGTAQSVRRDGDADAALKSAARKLDATYTLPLLAHATMNRKTARLNFAKMVAMCTCRLRCSSSRRPPRSKRPISGESGFCAHDVSRRRIRSTTRSRFHSGGG